MGDGTMARLLWRSAAAVLVVLPTAAWTAAPELGSGRGAPGLWLAGDKHNGNKQGGGDSPYRSACERAARDHGWSVRAVGEPKKMDGPGGGTFYVPMQVRGGHRSFDALCEARADGSFVGVKRRD